MVTTIDDGAAGGGGRLEGLRVLVVEDETVVSMLLEDMLAELGCEVVGPAARLGRALELATTTGVLDLAVLDVDLGGEEVYPVADALAARGVPFVFVTGYGKGGVRGAYRDRPTVQKPFQRPHLRRALADALAGGGARGTS